MWHIAARYSNQTLQWPLPFSEYHCQLQFIIISSCKVWVNVQKITDSHSLLFWYFFVLLKYMFSSKIYAYNFCTLAYTCRYFTICRSIYTHIFKKMIFTGIHVCAHWVWTTLAFQNHTNGCFFKIIINQIMNTVLFHLNKSINQLPSCIIKFNDCRQIKSSQKIKVGF